LSDIITYIYACIVSVHVCIHPFCRCDTQ